MQRAPSSAEPLSAKHCFLSVSAFCCFARTHCLTSPTSRAAWASFLPAEFDSGRARDRTTTPSPRRRMKRRDAEGAEFRRAALCETLFSLRLCVLLFREDSLSDEPDFPGCLGFLPSC